MRRSNYWSTLLVLLSLLTIQSVAAKNSIVVALRGTDTGELRQSPVPGETKELLCFDIDLIDIKTGEVIGTASDCLEVLGMDECGGLRVIGTTVFNFNGGTLISRGLTSVQPTTHGSLGRTHITGSIPEPGDNSILHGTKKFKKASGPVRLSGAVTMQPDLPNAGDLTISFDCLFVIELE